jgi:hypothetical protein
MVLVRKIVAAVLIGILMVGALPEELIRIAESVSIKIKNIFQKHVTFAILFAFYLVEGNKLY